MNNHLTEPPRAPGRWSDRALWLTPLFGVLVAVVTSSFLATRLLAHSLNSVLLMEAELGLYAVGSILVVFVIHSVAWNRFPSLQGKLLLTSLLVGLVTLFNGWMAARLMFVNNENLTVATILLIFATINGVAFSAFGFSIVTRSLRRMADLAQRVAEGDLEARAVVPGRDEVAQLGLAFNEMVARLQATAKEREELERLRRDLIAWVSHDLRTPLTGIRAMTEALHDGLVDDPETVQRYYRTIRADVIGLNRLIDDLFEMAQLDAGGLMFEKTPSSLRDLISDALESFQAVAQQRGVQLTGEVHGDLDAVKMNAEKIGRVLGNLISNALKYTPEGGVVRVSAESTPAGILVAVQDSGPGFAEKDLSRLFERFYRGEQARSRSLGGGAGLGLAIARSIVEAHGGQISAGNAPSGGARLAFTLPR